MIDWNLRNAIATLACVADGSTSLYLSSGGGIIGAGRKEPVRAAAKHPLQLAGASHKAFQKVTDHPVPPADHTRFAVVTTLAAYAASVPTTNVRSGQHPLSALGNAFQRVLTLLRQTTPDPSEWSRAGKEHG